MKKALSIILRQPFFIKMKYKKLKGYKAINK
jgi:hypothetical protein